jgi:putative tricarboxylic transport membrane protein
LVTVVGCLGSIPFSKIITIPARFLGPPIVFMTVIGSYAIRNNMFDVWIMLLFGVLGIISTRLKLHPGPIVLGFILGPYAEEGIVQSALVGMAEGGVLKYLVLRPISMILIVMSIVSALWPLYASWRRGKKPRA